ncbi:MAG: ATP synthase subunit I [Candidatus Limivivens sp.]|nr:ATP synthase subunit I [Candidatus Limivivens sp.]
MKRISIREKIERLHPVLKEVLAGILLTGVIFQISLMWLVDSKLYFTTGLWLGTAVSVFRICHMYYGINEALDMTAKDAESYSRKMAALRFVVTVAVFAGIYFLHLGNLVAVFLGMMTLKAAAYLQPLLHMAFEKIKRKGR